MAKPFVLRALKILGLEEILNIAEVPKMKKTALKKAAGEELISWDDEPKMPGNMRRAMRRTPSCAQSQRGFGRSPSR